MTRVKRGNISRKRHKKVLKLAKGYRGSLSKLYRPAHQVVLHALKNAYKDRKRRKRDFRRLWISRITAAVSNEGITYSRFIDGLHKQNIEINRKMLSELAIHEPLVFSEILNQVKSKK
jgi:large subunit ribosomal protein L20